MAVARKLAATAAVNWRLRKSSKSIMGLVDASWRRQKIKARIMPIANAITDSAEIPTVAACLIPYTAVSIANSESAALRRSIPV